MSSIGHIDASLRTDQGQVRDHNEDFVAYWEPTSPGDEDANGWLYVVADGVGGADAGEVASQFASERTIHHYLADNNNHDWGERLRQAMQQANTDLRQMVAENDVNSRMATTMVAAVLYDGLATIANVGDSRGYVLQNGEFRQVTKDQSLVARLLEEGAITEEEAVNHPRRNVILHSLGSETTPPIDLYSVSLQPGDFLVLCSDGLTRHVSDEEIGEMISSQDPAEATRALIQLANERGGEDNISVAVLQMGELPDRATVPAKVFDETIKTEPVDSPLMVQTTGDESSGSLWTFTGFLCLVQTILILLIWLIVR